MSEEKCVDGIVLAAGASSRMGSPKPLLQVEGTTFLERAVLLLREAGCRYVVAVVNAAEGAPARLADVSGAIVVVNETAGSEQIDSLRLALVNLADDCDGAIILPVDFPRIIPDTVRQLIAAFQEGDAPIINPSYNGVVGHPMLIARALFPELLHPDLPEGARSVWESHSFEARVIEVKDPGVTIDIDTRADYDQHMTSDDEIDGD